VGYNENSTQLKISSEILTSFSILDLDVAQNARPMAELQLIDLLLNSQGLDKQKTRRFEPFVPPK